jgi:hypothetical protein
MKIALGILLFTTVILTTGAAEKTESADGVWCRVYAEPGGSEARFFYGDGRYAWLAADVIKHKNGTVSAETHEDYMSRTGTWKMNGGEVESHEFWVNDYKGRFSPLHPVDEHYVLASGTLQKSATIRLRDPLHGLQHVTGSRKLVLINRLAELTQLQHGQIYETCNHAKEDPQDVAQEWLKFCQQVK